MIRLFPSLLSTVITDGRFFLSYFTVKGRVGGALPLKFRFCICP